MDFYTSTISSFASNNATLLPFISSNTTLIANATYSNDSDFFIEMDSHKRRSLYKAAMMIIKVVFPTLVAVGTAANMLVIVVLRRGAINMDNLSFFLSALAVVDTVFLYASAFKTWLRVMWGFELLHMGSWSCKLGLFLNHLCSTLSAWLVLVIAWQRWYTCSRPFDRCCPVDNSKCGYTALACLLLILVGANSYVLFTVELHEDKWGSVCVPSERYDGIVSDVFPLILLVLYSGLPAILLSVLNSLLARILYTSRRSLLTHAETARSNRRTDSHVRSRYNQVTALLMALSLSWFLLTTPHTLFKMVEPIPRTSHENAAQTFLNVLFFVFLYINHSINFFLYCALTRGFRREVRKLASKLVKCTASMYECCHQQLRRRSHHHPGQPFHASNSSINNVHNRHSNNESFVPLIDLDLVKPAPGGNLNGSRHAQRIICA